MASLPVLPSSITRPLRLRRLRAQHDSHQSRHVPFVLLVIFLMGTYAVLSCGSGSPGYHLGNALIWGFGFCVSGMLLGFLFAIPRILPAGAIIAPARPHNANGNGKRETDTGPGAGSVLSHPSHSPSEINSNLVEVSDWLTKIIVGVGLVELKHLPTAARGVADYIAPSLGLAPSMAAPVAGGIMLFYSVLGFLIGYLLTRIYLAVIIKWADNQVKNLNPVRLDNGTEIEASEMIRLQQSALADVQETVVNIVSTMPEQAGMATTSAVVAMTPGRVLWVDSRPANNALLVDQLTRANVVVEQVLTNKDALECLAKGAHPFDVVITDMAGFDHGRSLPDAGIDLTRDVLRLLPGQPVLVYCSKKEAELHGAAASLAGARLVTANGTHLIAEIARILKTAGRAVLIG
jgi:CheY-like chemotaxis protein